MPVSSAKPPSETCIGPSHLEGQLCGRPLFSGRYCQVHYKQKQSGKSLKPIRLQKPRATGTEDRFGLTWSSKGTAEAMQAWADAKQVSVRELIVSLMETLLEGEAVELPPREVLARLAARRKRRGTEVEPES
jgi:hypothetical protein